ncbi:aldo/keto reductase [Paenibacillus thiaminolyticus]|uniref:aldo/keto reductase n=1 Tax=Paenibacillus thiaminolyticus TaxID=49283 RepID=UPI0025428A31|nr:aldo/keto reductase [Paenibacillus thiaminolyticus]WII39744.1 aldo/keto reductase [Paenibacillus thiaminolyticus]
MKMLDIHGTLHERGLPGPDLVRVFYNDANWERYDRASKLAASKGVETIQAALEYVLHQRFPTGAIIGARNRKELRVLLCGSMAVANRTGDCRA